MNEKKTQQDRHISIMFEIQQCGKHMPAWKALDKVQCGIIMKAAKRTKLIEVTTDDNQNEYYRLAYKPSRAEFFIAECFLETALQLETASRELLCLQKNKE